MTQATGEATTGQWETLGAVVGENVRRLRRQRGLTQHELAQLWKRQGLNWPRSKIAALETGNRPHVNVADLILMAAGLGATVGEFFEGSGDVLLAPHPRVVDRESLRPALSGGPMDPDAIWLLPGKWGEPWGRPSEADRELARRLGVPAEAVAQAVMSIFDGRTLTEERDRRVANLGEMSMSERMAHRGHVTRELADLVEDQISKDAGERDR
jgi:transcriptional regulator with XRE-family HTH domain